MPFKAYVIALLAVSATICLSNPCCAAVDEYSMTSRPAPSFTERAARHAASADHTVAVRNAPRPPPVLASR